MVGLFGSSFFSSAAAVERTRRVTFEALFILVPPIYIRLYLVLSSNIVLVSLSTKMERDLAQLVPPRRFSVRYDVCVCVYGT